MSTPAEIVAEASKLSDKERQMVIQMLSQLDTDTTSSTGKCPDEELLYTKLSEAFEAVNGQSLPHYSVFAKQNMHSEYKKNRKRVEEYVDRHFGSLTKIERSKVYWVIANAHITRIRESHLPLTMNVIMQQLRNVSQSVEHEFPGYARSGLLKRIVLKHG